MALSVELVPVTNLLFSALVVIMGVMAWHKTKKEGPLYLAAAFVLFGISHLATIVGIGDSILFLIVRIIGYILIIGMLYRWYAAGG